MKIVNYIERHNFCWNDLLTKSNRTEIQTYKVEERTFGTPCITKISLTSLTEDSPSLMLSKFFVNRHTISLLFTNLIESTNHIPIFIAQIQAYKKGFTFIDSLSIQTITLSKNNNSLKKKLTIKFLKISFAVGSNPT